ncbi:hypothetical protein AMJ47_00845 [Parcubacteria bacterium DG_72]|nr:MAG: hypothetical protein AMJ47_00845 [Parcubacteria bacterium DG_72]
MSLKKIIIIAIIVLFFLIGVLGFWYWNRNPYSKEVLKIEIIGPAEADFSEEVEYTVKYKNNGNVRLEEPRLIFEFPEYSIVDQSFIGRKELAPEELGDIYPGEEKIFTFKGRLFGKEGELKTVRAWLSYQPKNLSARYESETSFSTKIKSIPLTFDFDLPSRVEANKEFDFSINYYSILDYPLSDLTIKIEYPAGFEFLKSTPESLSKNEWDIPILNKAEGGRIDIRGKITAELGDFKMFKAEIGFWREGELVMIKEISRGVEITEPFIDIYQEINGQKNYVASAGDLLHYEIYFRNVGEEAFKDLFLVLRMDGEGFDFDTIKTTDGEFEQGDNTIIWDGKGVSKLRFLDQGEEGKVEFWINLKEEWDIISSSEKDVVLKNTVLVSKMKEEFETKVNSHLSLQQEAQSFSNPIVGQDITYNITWQVKNYFNDVKNVKVKATLLPNVRLTGDISPEDLSSDFAFDSSSREIVWLVGDLEAGQGVIKDSPIISFQVILNPIYNQRGDQAVLMEQARVLAEDIWTQRFLEQEIDDLKTPQEVK